MSEIQDLLAGYVEGVKARREMILGKTSELDDMKLSEIDEVCERIRDFQNVLNITVAELTIIHDELRVKANNTNFKNANMYN